MLKSPIFANLSSCVQSNAMDTLPSEANRGLMKALITVGSACEDQAAKDAHWNKVLKPLCDRYLKFIYSEKATKFCEISTLPILCIVSQSKVEISQNIVAFSEYMNFTQYNF